jgi:hypothetical protein
VAADLGKVVRGPLRSLLFRDRNSEEIRNAIKVTVHSAIEEAMEESCSEVTSDYLSGSRARFD